MAALLNTKVINAAIAGSAVILLLFFLLFYSETGAPPSIKKNLAEDNRPDYFLHNTVSANYDQQGVLDLTVNTEKITHNPRDDSADIKAPQFELYRDGSQAWTITAQSGVVNNSGSIFDLQQRVVITSSDQATILKTPQLLIFPNKKLAKTSKPVTLQNPNGFTRSIGLEADLQTKTIKLLSQVRGQYEGVLGNDKD